MDATAGGPGGKTAGTDETSWLFRLFVSSAVLCGRFALAVETLIGDVTRGNSLAAWGNAVVTFCIAGSVAWGWSPRTSATTSGCSAGCGVRCWGNLFSTTEGSALLDGTGLPAFDGKTVCACFAVSLGTSGAGAGLACSLNTAVVFVAFPGGSGRGRVEAECGF